MSKPYPEHFGPFKAIGEGFVALLALIAAFGLYVMVVRGFDDLHRIADSLEALAAECGTTPDTKDRR